MPNNRTGLRYLRINGVIHSVAGEVTANLGGQRWRRLPSMDATPPAYAPERENTPFVEATLRDVEDMDVAAITALEDANVQLEFENGKTWVFNLARQTGSGDYAPEEGTLAIRFEAATAEEIR